MQIIDITQYTCLRATLQASYPSDVCLHAICGLAQAIRQIMNT